VSDKRHELTAGVVPVVLESVPDSQKPIVLEQSIEHTRAHMTETLNAIEHRLNPTELREKAVEELHVVEARVKEAVREQIEETKAKVTEELIEAKAKLKEELLEAKERLTEEVIEAKDRAKDEVKQAFVQVKHEVKDAFSEASQALRDATIGKVENMARRANETLVDTRVTVVETIRANPIPAALTGLGLLWLYMNRSRASDIRVRYAEDQQRGLDQRGGYDRGGFDRSYDRGLDRRFADGGYPAQYGSSGEGSYNQSRGGQRHEGGISETLHHAQQAAGHAVGQVQHRVSDIAHQAQDKVSGLAHQAQDLAHQAQDKVSGLAHQAVDAASDVKERVAATASELANEVTHRASELGQRASATASDLSHRASERVDQLSHQAHEAYDHTRELARQQIHRVEDTYHQTLQTNPLALGAIALALGTVVGLSLPSTRREDMLLGEARDQLLHRAQDVAHEAIETAHHYTEQAAEQVKGTLGAGQHA